jgi:hypothetical protein
MNEVLVELSFFGRPLVITTWKLIGYAGVLLFAGRWFVQLAASHRAGRSTIPRALLSKLAFTFSGRPPSAAARMVVRTFISPPLTATFPARISGRSSHEGRTRPEFICPSTIFR